MTEHTITWKGKAAQASLSYDEEDAAQIGEVIQKYLDGEYTGDVTFDLDNGTQGRAYMTPEMAADYKAQMIENGTWQS